MFFNAFPQTVLTWDSRSEKHDYFSALLFNDMGKKYVYITVGSALGIIKGQTCYQSYQNTLIILVGILSFLSNCQFSKIRL